MRLLVSLKRFELAARGYCSVIAVPFGAPGVVLPAFRFVPGFVPNTVPPPAVLIPVPLSSTDVRTMRIVAFAPLVAIPLMPVLEATLSCRLISTAADVDAATKPLLALLPATLKLTSTLELS